ncbi:MAG TPA: alpha/beta hydrolase [Polyangia bacterium]|nr:alpha/beta hydrolase [Polyangia bacterium]
MPVERVGEVELHFELRGSGAVLLFIPGLGLDLGAWDEVANALSSHRSCLLVDNRGSGRSPAPAGPYSVRDLAADIHGLLGLIGVDRVVAVGHSLGGFVALQLALEHPESIGGLVLISTAASGDLRRLGSALDAPVALAWNRGPVEDIVRGNLIAAVAEGFPAKQSSRFEEFVATRLAHPARGRGVAGQRDAVAAFDARERLWEVRCPTTVVHGLADRLVPPSLGRELARGIDGARLVELEGVGHLPLLEAPGELARIIDLSP